MKIGIPVAEYHGLDSQVYGHFGSAPGFALVDSENLSIEPVSNRDHDHVHGACSPVRALAGAKPDVVVVGGMGAGALRGLRSLGIRVYRCSGGTIAEAVRQLRTGELAELDDSAVCAGHGGGCGGH